MNIVDAVLNGARVVCGDRWIVGDTDEAEGETFFIVYEQRPRQKYPRVLTETSNQDEAARWVLGEK